MQKITDLLDAMIAKIPNQERLNPSVSAVPVAWHLEHSFTVFKRVVQAAQQSNPADFKLKFSIPRMIVFTTGKIPRGRGKTPEAAKPQGDITPERLQQSAEAAKQHLALLPTLDKNQWFAHPFFGPLNKKRIYKMLEIHTRHHLTIIDDILKG
jgi:hypothetical protein